jgi:DNA-directed DNA polymerase III PolC
VHLHVHSHFSFLAGTLSIERIITHAVNKGYQALALTDTNNVSGIMEFYAACRKAGIKPIPGAEFRLQGIAAVALARSWKGYQEICSVLSRLVEYAPPARILESNEDATEDGGALPETDGALSILATLLVEGLSGEVVLLTSHVPLLDILAVDCRATLYVELIKADEARWPTLLEAASRLRRKVIATNDVYFGEAGGRRLHTALRAIAGNLTLGTLNQKALAPEENFFIGEEEFRDWFRRIPGALQAREDVIATVDVQFDTTSCKFASYPDIPDSGKSIRLRALTEAGLRERYPHGSNEAVQRMNKELDIIARLGFTDYFLVAWDLIRYARFRGYPYVGRGSGANSIVAYCLRITNVDPVALDLFFERFLNPERRSPPDFDIDFSWRDRDDVIAYALSKYGHDRTAMICTISTFNPRGALRESGKILGFSSSEIKEVTSMLPGYGSRYDFRDPAGPFRRRFGPLLSSPHGATWVRIATALLDFPNHYGIHSGGVILAPDALHRYTATQIAPKGVRITQQDMFSMEDWRLEKLDILSIRGLGVFEDSMQEIKRRSGVLPPIHDYAIACEDARTKEIMRKGETVGCFYVESPAMVQLLKKLRTDTFEMLTAASSIIRPGVAQSGMMQAFIERHHDASRIDPPHPAMADLLRSTYGVMVYQEDVIKVAHFIGKLSLGEADLLRRAMSGKMRSREALRALRHTFFDGCAREGIEESVSREIWRQMESFAGYSFCKAHSASYAVLSFQEAWLKAHYPALFLCAVLNNQGGYYRPEVYIQEARRLGIAVLLPDVNTSEELHTCPNDRTIQLGFLHIKDCTAQSRAALLRERRERGRYTSFEDFLWRSAAGFEDTCILVRCGACDTFAEKRAAMLVRAKLHFNRQRGRGETEALRFEQPLFESELARLADYTPEQIAGIEMETFSYTVSTHILSHFREALVDTVKSTELHLHIGSRVSVGGWMIAAKLSRTKKGERMMFINLDDAEGRIDVVLFPRCFDSYSHLLRSAGPFIIRGRVKQEYNVLNIIAESVALLSS